MPVDRYDRYMAQPWRRLCWVGLRETILTILSRIMASIRRHQMFDPVAQADHNESVRQTNSFAAGVVNAVFIFVTFLLSLPALFLPTNRGWLRTQGWLVVVCATFTLGLGLAVWVDTLQTRAELNEIWQRESPLIRSLLQQKVCIVFYSWMLSDWRNQD